jgi:hypothetical protein
MGDDKFNIILTPRLPELSVIYQPENILVSNKIPWPFTFCLNSNHDTLGKMNMKNDRKKKNCLIFPLLFPL